MTQPELDFANRVHGLAGSRAASLGDMLDFYRQLGLRPWIELPPGTEELASRLADEGARPVDSIAVLYGVPQRTAATGVDVHELRASEGLRFATLLLDGHRVPADEAVKDARAGAAWAATEDARIYVARVDGAEAAAALSLRDGVAYLANASTLPRFRRRAARRR